jgi:hypothetical protein
MTVKRVAAGADRPSSGGYPAVYLLEHFAHDSGAKLVLQNINGLLA